VLYEYVHAEDPIKTVHGLIGQELAQMNDIVRQMHRKESTYNIRGEKTPAEVWERL